MRTVAHWRAAATTFALQPPRASASIRQLRPRCSGAGRGAAGASALGRRVARLGNSRTPARLQRCRRLSEVEASATEETSNNLGQTVGQLDSEEASTSAIGGLEQKAEGEGSASTTATKEEAPSDQAARPDLTVDAGAQSVPKAEPAAVEAHPIQLPEDDMFGTKELWGELKDQGGFGKRGEGWVFAQVAVFFLILFPPIPVKGLVDLLGALALTAGLVFIIYGVFSLGRQLSPLPVPRKKHKLVTSGMYGYVRHPMYGGLLMAAFGLAALTRNEGRLALSALLWWVLEQKAALEEKTLGQMYQEYEEYKKRVNKFFPFIY